jgi:hypothetical protein
MHFYIRPKFNPPPVPAVGIALMTNQSGVDSDPAAKTLQQIVALG